MRLLLVSDACCPTGFARVNENLVRRLPDWDVAMLGVNATGDPYDWPCRVYPAHIGGDPFGYDRIVRVVQREEPDVILLHSDPWVVANYVDRLEKATAKKILEHCPPIVAYMPVDAPAMRRSSASQLNKISLSVFYTDFGVQEARAAGFTGLATWIPLGIDPELYHPVNRDECRSVRQLPADAFVVGNVNRNQPRKRLDLTIAYFARWAKEYRRDDALLYLHCAAGDQLGWNIGHLGRYYGLRERILIPDKMTPREGTAESKMRHVYGALDVQVSTTLGEGFGLTTMEGMGCGIPQIVPEWSALGEWARGAVRYVPVTATQAHNGQESNCIGGVADETEFVEALDELYRSAELRAELGQRGYERSREPQFSWDLIAAKWNAALNDVLGSTPALVAAA